MKGKDAGLQDAGHTPVTPTLGKQVQEDQVFKASVTCCV